MPGDRLHGVLAEFGAPTAGEATRFTLILNFWRSRPLGARPAELAPPPATPPEDTASSIGKKPPPRPPPVVVSLLDASEGEWAEADALAAAASFCTAPHAPLVAITSFEERSVWLGMHDRGGELEISLPSLDFEARGAGADLVEWCAPVRNVEEEEGERGAPQAA